MRELEGTGVEVLDTRKTTPGLRTAREAGGGGRGRPQPPHRPLRRDPGQGEPHRPRRWRRRGNAAWRSSGARRACPVEVECRTLAEVEEALEAGAERLLLDNMTPAELAAAAVDRSAAAPRSKRPDGIITPESEGIRVTLA